jgi:hypothetical protein
MRRLGEFRAASVSKLASLGPLAVWVGLGVGLLFLTGGCDDESKKDGTTVKVSDQEKKDLADMRNATKEFQATQNPKKK